MNRHSLPEVKVFKNQFRKTEEKPFGEWVKIGDGTGWFHTWGCNYQEFEAGAGNFTVAIIEREDGTIEMTPADMIQFLNRNYFC